MEAWSYSNAPDRGKGLVAASRRPIQGRGQPRAGSAPFTEADPRPMEPAPETKARLGLKTAATGLVTP